MRYRHRTPRVRTYVIVASAVLLPFWPKPSQISLVTSLLLLAIWLGLMPSVLRCQAYMDIRDELVGMAVVASGGCSWKLRLGGAPPIDAISSYTNIGRPRNLSQ